MTAGAVQNHRCGLSLSRRFHMDLAQPNVRPAVGARLMPLRLTARQGTGIGCQSGMSNVWSVVFVGSGVTGTAALSAITLVITKRLLF